MLSPEKRACWQALQRQAITLTPQEKVQDGDMPGDTVRITAPVCRRVEKLLPHLAAKLEEKYGEYIPAKLVIAISGGSGSGKTSGAVALREALAQVGLTGYVLSGDNYPRRVPEHNDEERLAIFRSVGFVWCCSGRGIFSAFVSSYKSSEKILCIVTLHSFFSLIARLLYHLPAAS